MLHERFRHLTGLTWDQAVAQTRRLSHEAEALHDAAYALLHQQALSPETWAAFSSIKKQAERKSAQARQEWLKFKRILSSVQRASHQMASNGPLSCMNASPALDS